jgi:serine/threonine protein kinase
LKEHFVSRIRGIPVAHRRGSFSVKDRFFKIQFGELGWFWSFLPKLIKLRDGVEWPDPADGVIITKENVDRARSVLCRFRDAWIAANENVAAASDEDKLNLLERMPKIAMVLWVTRRHHLFNKFIEEEIEDDDMDRDPYLFEVLQEDAHYIGSQYSRVHERQWNDGEHLELKSDEPLPLEHLKEYKSGPFSAVDKVKDLWHPDKEYARKVVRPDPGSEGQIKTEITNLKELCKDDHGHHFVKYVKTYQRGEEIGVLLSPVAREDLNDLLRKCCHNKAERQNNRPALLRALGCLAYSLCYLHNVKLYRHRDVKPHNILCLKPVGQQEEFMWSDFGLAYDFSQQAGSGTFDQDFRATPQYEAPEIDGEQGSWHGRSADIFSFGCVILEIVSVLAMHKDAFNENVPLRQCWHYKNNIPKLEQWIQKTTAEMKKSGDRTIRKVLELSSGMIKKDPMQRFKIGQVVLKLAELKENGPDTPHPFCDRCVVRRKTDQSRNPKHPQIFHHEKVNWQTWRR